ncbi:MAG: SDR family NAD(P)-dependent oxidoreductase [Minisyncoccales bacterium]
MVSKKMFDLKDKVAVITGASGGLGESMAEALSEQGANIVILDIKEKQGNNVVKKLKTKSKFYKIDVSDEESVRQAMNSVKKDFNKIDILINNAGTFSPCLVKSTNKQEWEKLMSINVTGYVLISKYFSGLMKKGGKIINISSIAGHHAFEGAASYNASKGAVIQLTKSMAMEFAQKNINVNAVCPGIFVTEMTKDLVKDPGVKSKLNNAVLLKRAAKAEEIKGLIVYLASDESSYMTGSVITIDGGWTCHL